MSERKAAAMNDAAGVAEALRKALDCGELAVSADAHVAQDETWHVAVYLDDRDVDGFQGEVSIVRVLGALACHVGRLADAHERLAAAVEVLSGSAVVEER
jgi:hypothetical protein